MPPELTPTLLRRSVGQELFVSDWVDLDREFHHLHLSGAHLLSMLADLYERHLTRGLAADRWSSHGADRITSLRPLRSGARVRLRAQLLELIDKPGLLHCVTRNTFELAGSDEPAMVVDRTSVLVTGPPAGTEHTDGPLERGTEWRPADFLHYWARCSPDVELDVLGNSRRTYAEGDRDVRRCAAALIRSGVSRGDRIAVLTTPRPEFLTILLALSEIGATWVGLDPGQTLEELAHVVSDSAASMLFTLAHRDGRSYQADAAELAARIPALRQIVTIGGTWKDEPRAERFAPAFAAREPFEAFVAHGDALGEAELQEAAAACRPDDTAVLVYTSGTTGRPKGAMISAGALGRGCLIQAARQQPPRPRVLAYLPVNHLAGVMDVGILPVSLGGCLVYQERFDPDAALELLQSERINLWGGIPTMFRMITERPGFDAADLSALRRITWGGAPMPADLVARLRRTGAQLGMIYGLTEACVALTYSDDDADDGTLATTIGKPTPGLEFRIADSHGRPVPDGQIGEIQTRSTCTMQGYFGMPQATAAAFTADGYLHTGDQALRLPDGNVRLVGRLTEMYKSGGRNVYPREVEVVLERHPGVAAAAVVPMPDALYDEVGIAYLAVRPGSGVSASELDALCRQSLANYKHPRRFEIRTELPLLPNGKIDKRALTAWARDLEPHEGEPPSTT
ncbi:AMP-binding protein [Kitasatospora sp. NPDC085879]|uniref:AMP-binding protein n=1 Tax=Kitasatospora sp. NPDC085879 TaxID=3154769 RepID=UPI003420D678